jgi:hypothetical protein
MLAKIETMLSKQPAKRVGAASEDHDSFVARDQPSRALKPNQRQNCLTIRTLTLAAPGRGILDTTGLLQQANDDQLRVFCPRDCPRRSGTSREDAASGNRFKPRHSAARKSLSGKRGSRAHRRYLDRFEVTVVRRSLKRTGMG